MKKTKRRGETSAALRACYRGYVVQAAAVNLMPLLFGVFQQRFGLSYGMLSALVFISFGVQIVTDLLAVCFSNRLECRCTVVVAHACCAAGLILLGVLPLRMSSPFLGMVLAAVVYSTGCGLIGVTVGALTDALPHPSGGAVLSLLHSFYCWGQVAVIALSTLLLRFLGNENWFVLPLLWSILPLYNMICFSKVQLEGVDLQQNAGSVSSLLRARSFAVILVLMFCAGAAETAMSQWSSLFAEQGLGLPKLMGDLFGPCLFAACMGAGRVWQGLSFREEQGGRILITGAVLCGICYMLTAFSPWPWLSLSACAVCGLGAGILWPGVLNLACARFPGAGTALFGILEICGDVGSAVGPAAAGFISETAGLSAGLWAASLFPVLMPGLLLLWHKAQKPYSRKKAIDEKPLCGYNSSRYREELDR